MAHWWDTKGSYHRNAFTPIGAPSSVTPSHPGEGPEARQMWQWWRNRLVHRWGPECGLVMRVKGEVTVNGLWILRAMLRNS